MIKDHQMIVCLKLATIDQEQVMNFIKKIIDNKKFALIIKPKKPAMLKNKLVYNLLIKAKETKRCIAFDNASIHGIKNFEDIPAKRAMASDLTIQDTLLAGTAGLESALTGTKSVFLIIIMQLKVNLIKRI